LISWYHCAAKSVLIAVKCQKDCLALLQNNFLTLGNFQHRVMKYFFIFLKFKLPIFLYFSQNLDYINLRHAESFSRQYTHAPPILWVKRTGKGQSYPGWKNAPLRE